MEMLRMKSEKKAMEARVDGDEDGRLAEVEHHRERVDEEALENMPMARPRFAGSQISAMVPAPTACDGCRSAAAENAHDEQHGDVDAYGADDREDEKEREGDDVDGPAPECLRERGPVAGQRVEAGPHGIETTYHHSGNMDMASK
ncbi:hypothetical protein CHGG_00573 [Chaetomium globosum CBS 148.51]|uniref:Uncharacterized protein n=1 Tax=Chaetomium globosum (strain ATCC 6205 / CBS 148.51 / DSM 1962 / NBRC 6347 / NRRL 1970) TaxID=306901 RepID=Q2HGT1_CHAGB|nr:uncharacterized protein CHGG_00573 [Chaetomium globosum CBS 148.51]EAQ92338.1 hypothetical protein CHGG_00573 [Chaetomium globosum CBS 148.51]